MEVRKPKIKAFPYGEWKDNETLEKMANDLNDGGVNLVLGNLDQLINWGRSNSLWSLTFATSCCGIEFMAVGCARYDFSRFGFEVTRNSPRQADLIMCAGTITHKMAPALKRLYDEMAEPKYVVAVGGCAISGGPFKDSYHVMRGIDEIIPVDVYIPGCPPRPEAILYGMMQLQRKVKIEKFFGGVNHKQNSEERELGRSNESLIFEEKLGISNIAFHVGRVEDMKAERDTFDIVTARGFAAMNIFLEFGAPLAKKGGTLIAMKSLRGEEELVKSKFAIHRLGLSLSSTKKDVLPDGEIRLNYYFEKKQPTPPSYPRPWAEILKKPL